MRFILTAVALPLIALVGLVALSRWVDQRYRGTLVANDWLLAE